MVRTYVLLSKHLRSGRTRFGAVHGHSCKLTCNTAVRVYSSNVPTLEVYISNRSCLVPSADSSRFAALHPRPARLFFGLLHRQ